VELIELKFQLVHLKNYPEERIDLIVYYQLSQNKKTLTAFKTTIVYICV